MHGQRSTAGQGKTMETKTLNELYSNFLFSIPDYQRGYAWETKQWSDFVQDIDALVNENIGHHYTGTVVIFKDKNRLAVDYVTDKLRTVDVVDGQQRLATVALYLSIILHKLINMGETDYVQKIPVFLYAGSKCRLSLNEDTNDCFFDLLKYGHPNTEASSIHEKRLLEAHKFLEDHLLKELSRRPGKEIEYIRELYDAITQKLAFTFYAIEEECEIGMTFELMNSRGKDLSVLELLKNYLMYWISRNSDDAERTVMTDIVNKAWKDAYTNIGTCSGREDQCLRVAWTLLCSHTPKNWAGYKGFKQDSFIPLRNFDVRSKADTKRFIIRFAEELGKISRHYACILEPTLKNALSTDEFIWLNKIHHSENIANFLPLLVAARMHCQGGNISNSSYLSMLKALECYAYRVFLFEGKRSNAGQSNFYSWAHEVLTNPEHIQDITAGIRSLINYYAAQDSFLDKIRKPADWYSRGNLLKYTLYEYELFLLDTEGKGESPRIAWEQLDKSTLEHILPQNPEEDSHWKEVWDGDNTGRYLHDIGNLVLTHNNSNYRNFEFARKKGLPGISPSYSDSDIRQERKISSYSDWRPEEVEMRRQEIATWIIGRWDIAPTISPPSVEISEDDDYDAHEEGGDDKV